MRWLTLLLAVLGASPSYAGWYTGNAGDVYAAEFVLTGRDLVQRLRFLSSSAGPTILPDASELSAVVERVMVHSEEHVFNNGFEVDAANLYPAKNQIILNYTRWRDVRRPSETRRRFLLVLHEYLWMMGTEDLGFKHSGPMVDLLNIENYSPNAFWNPINPVNVLELKSAAGREGCYFNNMNFDVVKATETMDGTTLGSCEPKDMRRVVVSKYSGLTPPSTGVRGLYHRYKVEIYNGADVSMGSVIFEPEWGRCLHPDDTACRSSGKIIFADVELLFGFLRKN